MSGPFAPVRLGEDGDLELEVRDMGAGDPVVLVQTALTADELVPVAEHLDARGTHRVVVYHRRGYAGSSPVSGPGSVVRDAADCRGLLAALGLGRVHLVGLSYSGAVAIQVAADAPDQVHTLTLVEPPPVHVPSVEELRAAIARLRETRRVRGADAALEEFAALVIGPSWRKDLEAALPGAVAQMQHDAATFFDTDLPALVSWSFTVEDTYRITCPVLHVGGTDSGPWFAEVRELVRTWWPGAEDVRLDGADHSLAVTHAAQVADALADFLDRHAIAGSSG